MTRKLSDAVRSVKERLGEEPPIEEKATPSLEHYIQRRSGPRGLSTVDNLLGRSDPKAAEKRLLGDENKTDYVLEGIRRLRENIPPPKSRNVLGRSIWRQVLDEQRGTKPSIEPLIENEHLAESPSLEQNFSWPEIHEPRLLLSWSRWHTSPENHAVARGADLIMEEPGHRLNPFVVVGGPGTGKTHFISALGNSLQSVMPHRSIFRIEGSSLIDCPSNCEEAFRQAGAILVDDIHEIISHGTDDSLGRLLHIAFDHGIQIVCTTRSMEVFDSIPTSSLRQVLTGAAIGTLQDPGIATLIAHLRRRSIAEGASIDEDILSYIAQHSPTWAGSLNALQIVLSSISEGFVPVDEKDVSILLDGRSLSPRSKIQSQWDPDLVGKKLVEEVLDDVLPKGFDPQIDMSTPEKSLQDEWTPSNFELPSGRLIPSSPLPSSKPSSRISNSLSGQIESRFFDAESELHRRRYALHEIERELSGIQERMSSTTPSDLVALTDRLLALEGQLETISETPLGEEIGEITPFDPSEITVEIQYPILKPAPGQVPHHKTEASSRGTARLRKRRVKMPV
ncbi:MAG: hypothetical protein CMB31_07105 [Euryarchaeota archaeon]|nr:hypothetical protein [Euryarchaeota archaeon]